MCKKKKGGKKHGCMSNISVSETEHVIGERLPVPVATIMYACIAKETNAKEQSAKSKNAQESM